MHKIEEVHRGWRQAGAGGTDPRSWKARWTPEQHAENQCVRAELIERHKVVPADTWRTWGSILLRLEICDVRDFGYFGHGQPTRCSWTGCGVSNTGADSAGISTAEGLQTIRRSAKSKTWRLPAADLPAGRDRAHPVGHARGALAQTPTPIETAKAKSPGPQWHHRQFQGAQETPGVSGASFRRRPTRDRPPDRRVLRGELEKPCARPCWKSRGLMACRDPRGRRKIRPRKGSPVLSKGMVWRGLGNMEEIRARKGRIVAIAPKETCAQPLRDHLIQVRSPRTARPS